MPESRRTPLPVLVELYLADPTGKAADAFASDEVFHRIGDVSNAEDAWQLVLALIDASNEDQLQIVATGPLEDLVRQHAPTLIERIEAESRRSPKFRGALEAIWLSRGDLPAPILDRVVAASGGAIKPLGQP